MVKVVNLRDFGGRRKAEAAGVIYVGRPTPLGNPFSLLKFSRQNSIDRYRRWLYERLTIGDEKVIEALESLTDKSVIGCFCKPLACHGDIIVKAWTWWRTKNGFASS